MARGLFNIKILELSLVEKAAGSNSSFIFYKEDTGEVGFEKFVSMVITKAEERLVMGVVYEPDTEDAQGDTADAAEVKKAAYDFMQEVQVFKVSHGGQKANIKVLESYIAPVDLTIAERKIKKGSWVITVRVLSDKIWKAVKDGILTGFSMAGHASTKSVSKSDSGLWPSLSGSFEKSSEDDDKKTTGEEKWPSISRRPDLQNSEEDEDE